MTIKSLAYFSAFLATTTFFAFPTYAHPSIEERLKQMEKRIDQIKKDSHSTRISTAQKKHIHGRLKDMEKEIQHLKQEISQQKKEENPPAPTPLNDSSIKVGGRVKLDAYHDMNARDGTYGIFGGRIPLEGIDADATRKKHTNFALTGSRISVEAKKAFGSLPTRAYFEIDFSKDASPSTSSYAPRLRHFYAEFANFLIGQTNYTFSDPAAYGTSLDNLYGQGRQAMLRYTHPFNEKLKLAIAAEKPDSQYLSAAGNFETNANDGQSKYPDIATQLRYEDNKWGHMAISGIVRRVGAKTTANTSLVSYQQNAWGWGLGISGKYKFYRNHAVFGQASGGRGIGRYIDDLNNNNGQDFYLQIPTAANPGLSSRFEMLRAFNILGGLELWPTEKMNLNFGGSLTRLQVPQGIANVPQFNKNLQRYFANIIYKLLPNSDIGFQIMHYKRHAGTLTSYKAKDTRLLVSFIYRF